MIAKSKERRDAIIAGAFEALKKNGLPLPSYDQISAEAGLSRQLLRHYYSDPVELMEALCDQLAATYRTKLMEGIIRGAPGERLGLFLDFYFDQLSALDLKKPRDDQVYDAMVSLAAGQPRIRANLQAQYGLLRHVLAHEVQISHPELPQAACAEIGGLFVSLMYGHWRMKASLGVSGIDHKVAREAMDRIIESYTSHYVERDDEPEPPEDETASEPASSDPEQLSSTDDR